MKTFTKTYAESPKQGEAMNRIRTTLTAVVLAVLAVALPAACANATVSASTSQQDPETHGWRYRTGNVCVQDWTGGVISDGIKRAVMAWSKAEDINLFYRRNCTSAGFGQSQTVTVMTYAWDTYYGECDRYHVWTQRGYLQPGLITRAVVHVNSACNTYAVADRAYLVAKALGHPLGLDVPKTRSDSVMAHQWLPTIWDYQRIEDLYPW